MKTVYLPLESTPICGHSYPGFIGGDLMVGREECCRSVIQDGVRYIGHVEYGSCSKCNAAQNKRIEKQIAALKKAERAKTAGNSRVTRGAKRPHARKRTS